MEVNPDFRDLLQAFGEFGVKYLIVGAYAVMRYTEPRFTKDLDIWVEPSLENAEKVWQALAKFGAPLEQISVADFANKELIYQIGLDPNRVDILMDVPGVAFSTAWKNRVDGRYGDQPVHFLSRKDLIRSKRKAGRDQDLLDLKRLKGQL